MIKDICIKNYKGFKNFEIKDFKQFNIITGRNNAGKSSLLEAISMLYSPVSAYYINWLALNYNSNTCYSFFHNLDTDIPIEISTTNEKLKLLIDLHEKIEEEQRYIRDDKPENLTKKQVGLRFNYSSKYIGKTDIFIGSESRYRFQRKYEDLHISSTKLINLRSMYLEDYVKFFDEIQTNKQDEIIINLLKETIIPELNNIALAQDNTLKIDVGYDKYLPFGALGDGIKTLFKILIAIYNNRNGILLIDEIENGFHYSVLDSIWRVIIRAVQEFNVQIFVSTHSKECISSYMKVFEEMNLKDDFDNYFRLERDENEIIHVSYSSNELKAALENNFEVR